MIDPKDFAGKPVTVDGFEIGTVLTVSVRHGQDGQIASAFLTIDNGEPSPAVYLDSLAHISITHRLDEERKKELIRQGFLVHHAAGLDLNDALCGAQVGSLSRGVKVTCPDCIDKIGGAR